MSNWCSYQFLKVKILSFIDIIFKRCINAQSTNVFEERVLRKISEPMSWEVTGGTRNCKMCFLICSAPQMLVGNQTKEDEIGWAKEGLTWRQLFKDIIIYIQNVEFP